MRCGYCKLFRPDTGPWLIRDSRDTAVRIYYLWFDSIDEVRLHCSTISLGQKQSSSHFFCLNKC